jgi:hypothetical protein
MKICRCLNSETRVWWHRIIADASINGGLRAASFVVARDKQPLRPKANMET